MAAIIARHSDQKKNIISAILLSNYGQSTVSAKLDLNLLRSFVAVAEAGGFTAGADRAGLAKSKLSQHVAQLEARLGQRLFNRTTRHVALTGVGRQLYEECAPQLANVQAACDALGRGNQRLTGRLRISATVDYTARFLAAAVAEFSALHPSLQIELRSDDKVVDLVTDGIDVAFRIGWLADSTARARRLGTFEQACVAAPAYLRNRGVPKHPDELAEHDWIALTLLRAPLTWTFHRNDAHAVTVRMRARLRVDATAALRVLLLNGAGVSIIDVMEIDDDVRAGRLVHVLPGWKLPQGGIFAVRPPGPQSNPSASAFVEFLTRGRASAR